MNTILNPSGRIGPVTFRNAALILILIGALFSILPYFRPDMALVTFASMLLIYPWMVIWVKRFHDAGKPGSRFLIVLAVWLVAGLLANKFLVSLFVPNPPPIDPNFIWLSMQAQMQANTLPGTIVSTLISLGFVLVVNEELKSDPGENAYGPPEGCSTP